MELQSLVSVKNFGFVVSYLDKKSDELYVQLFDLNGKRYGLEFLVSHPEAIPYHSRIVALDD